LVRAVEVVYAVDEALRLIERYEPPCHAAWTFRRAPRPGTARQKRRAACCSTWQCEQAIRNYDPCISCATHFLDLTVDRA
jgi:coenzyme F420-reducing hydrogenase alpha subunit